jgi:site-specific recombinase XerD
MTEIQKLLKDYLDYLEIEKNRSPLTRQNYERYLRYFFQWGKIKNIRQVDESRIRDFRIYLARQKLKKNTQNYYLIALRNFLKYLVNHGCDVLAPDRIELPQVSPRQIDLIEYADLERLLNAPKGDDLRTLRDRAILEILFSTGLRLSELCGLNRYHDFNKKEITVRGKGDKLRLVFLSDRAAKAVKEYFKKRTDAEEALFVSLSKSQKPKVIGRITPRAVQRLIDHYGRRAGIAKCVHPHMLRHFFATDLLANGADLRSVQELLGHSNLATTQIYTHITNRQLKEVHKNFHAKKRN